MTKDTTREDLSEEERRIHDALANFVRRRGLLTKAGAALGAGAVVGGSAADAATSHARADPQGQIGTSSDPVADAHVGSLNANDLNNIEMPDPSDGIQGIETAIQNLDQLNNVARDTGHVMLQNAQYSGDHTINITGDNIPQRVFIHAHGARIKYEGTGTCFHWQTTKALFLNGASIFQDSESGGVGLHVEDSNYLSVKNTEIDGFTDACIRVENTEDFVDGWVFDNLRLRGGDGIRFEPASSGESGSASFQNGSAESVNWFDGVAPGVGIRLDGIHANCSFQQIRGRASDSNSEGLIKTDADVNLRASNFLGIHFEDKSSSSGQAAFEFGDTTTLRGVPEIHGIQVNADAVEINNPNNVAAAYYWTKRGELELVGFNDAGIDLDVIGGGINATAGNGGEIPGIATSQRPNPGFDSWRQVSSDRPATLIVEVEVETDGSAFGRVALEVDETGGTTADYNLDITIADPGEGSGVIDRGTCTAVLPAGAQYQIVNHADPNGNNDVTQVVEFVL